MDKDNFFGCAGVTFTLIILIAFCLFIEPAIVLKAWNMVAVPKFCAPSLTYWECFWATLAIQGLFKASNTVNNNSK